MKLYWKIFILIFSTFLLVLCGVSYLVSLKYISDAEGHLEKRTLLLGGIISRDIEQAHVESHWPFISLNNLSQARSFLLWWVVRNDGTIHLANNAAVMGMRAADYFPEVSATPDDHQVIFFRRKNCVLYQAPLQLGREKWSFWLGFSLDEISEIKKSLFSHALLLATFTMGGLGLVLFYMVRHFLQPVQDLTMGAAAMSDGQLSHRMPIRSKDEVGRLAEAFNQMAQSLQEKNQQIRQSQLRLQAVFDGIPDPLIMVDRDLRIKLLNQAALDYFQADSLESIVDKHCYQVLKGLAAPCAGCEVPAAVSQRGLLLCERKCARAPDRVEEVFVYPLPNASIQEGGSIIQICDVTEARNIERSLLQSGACPKLS